MNEFHFNNPQTSTDIDESAIVTNGLICYLDAKNAKSIPAPNNTIWRDLSGKGNHGTLVNSPVFNNGVISFDGSTNYITISSINFAALPYTIMGAARYSGSIRARIISAISNNWLLGHWNAMTENYYAEGWITSNTGEGPNDTNWRIYAGTGRGDNLDKSLYINGNWRTTNAGNEGPNGLCIGCSAYGGLGEFSDGQCGFILAYNRELTAEEVLQNYKVMKGRYLLN